MVKRAFVFAFLVSMISGCHGLGPEPQYWTQTPIHNTFYATAPFSYILNGQKIVRSEQDARGNQTLASAKLEPNWLFGSGKILTIDLDPATGQSIELQVMLRGLGPATYLIAVQAQPDSAIASVKSDYSPSYNLATGFLNITSFDTVASTVSGTFSFSASSRTSRDTIRVLAGSFSNVPVYVGSFGQGYVTAYAENEYFASSTTDYGATAYLYNTSNGLHIQAHALDQNGNERVITLYAENPHVATFNLTPYGYAEEGTSYQSANTPQTSGTGTLKITKFDTLTHRLSGTFNYTVDSYYSTVRITNGVIEDLHWFVL